MDTTRYMRNKNVALSTCQRCNLTETAQKLLHKHKYVIWLQDDGLVAVLSYSKYVSPQEVDIAIVKSETPAKFVENFTESRTKYNIYADIGEIAIVWPMKNSPYHNCIYHYRKTEKNKHWYK